MLQLQKEMLIKLNAAVKTRESCEILSARGSLSCCNKQD